MHGHLEVVNRLLEAGAAIDQADSKGYTALMRACIHGHLEIAIGCSRPERQSIRPTATASLH